MKKIFEDNLTKIYCGDSSKGLPLEDNSVHLIITSPPYNVGINYDNYNDEIHKEEYYKMITQVFKECYRVLVKGGRIAINCPSCIKQHRYSRNSFLAYDFTTILRQIGFLDREWITWCKIPIPQNDKVYSHNFFGKKTSWGSWLSPSSPAIRDLGEYIIVMDKETSKLEGNKEDIDITKEEFLKYTNNVWHILPTNENRTGHPASFPEELVYRLLKLYSYKNNTILDPFAGGGTVGYVCKMTKRKSILIDISEKYCNLMKKKLAQMEFI